MLDAKGEIETFADTINEMIDTLATFADQVTTVARVKSGSKVLRQAKCLVQLVPERFDDNVNELAANLTTQVRAIASSYRCYQGGSDAVDLSRGARRGAVFKDNINQMIANLQETTQKNTEQDWLNQPGQVYLACSRVSAT